MTENIKLLSIEQSQAIKMLESEELAKQIETSELLSADNHFSAFSWYCEECGEHNESDLRSGCEIDCEHCDTYCPDVDDNTYKLAELVYSQLVRRGEY